MAKIIGTLSDGEKIVVKDVSIDLRSTGAPGGLQGFTGSFTLGPHDPFLAPGQSYTLTANDGRAGRILVAKASVGSNKPTTVEFHTSGPFQ